MVDSDDKAEMGYLYEAMDRAKEEIKKNIGRGFKKWWDMIDKRWDKQLHQDIHAAGYFLNPRFQYSSKVTNDNEVLTGFRHVVERLEPDISKQLDIDREVELYRMKVGAFNSQKARIATKQVTPAEWWSIIGREQAPNLTRLAMRVLSQTVSSSNCERNWTTFALIHTKIRNRLTMEKLKKLVFVHYNMRLRERHCKRKTNNDQVIDLDHIFHEEDPLVEWTRETEDRLLDDRDNSWMDEAIAEAEEIAEAERIKSNQPRPSQGQAKRSDKRKQAVTTESEDDSPSDDQGSTGGGCGASEYDHATQSSWDRGFDTTYSHGYREHERQQNEERRKDVHGKQSGHPGYRRSTSAHYGGYDNPAIHESYTSGYSDSHDNYYTPYRHSDVYGDYACHDMYGSNINEQSSNQGSHYMPIFEQSRPSAYDNMMTSFLGPDQMQYCYPPYYSATQPDYDEVE